MKLDLSDFDSIATCAKLLLQRKDKIDIIINNAACSYSLEDGRKTKQGYEMMFGTNYLGHYILNRVRSNFLKHLQLLAEKLIESKGKLVIVASDGHRFVKSTKDFENFKEHAYYSSSDKGLSTSLYQYGVSKLANVLHSLEFSKRYPGIIVNSLHPGAIDTALGDDAWLKKFLKPFMFLFFKTPIQGAQTTLHVATSPKVNVTGKYFSDLTIVEESDVAKNEELAKKLWEWSEAEAMEKCDFFKKKFSK